MDFRVLFLLLFLNFAFSAEPTVPVVEESQPKAVIEKPVVPKKVDEVLSRKLSYGKEDSVLSSKDQKNNELDPMDSISSIFFALIVIVALIISAGYAWKKYSGKVGFSTNDKKYLEHIETMPLGAKKSVSIIRAGNQYLLVGQTEQNINQLSELMPDFLIDEENPVASLAVPKTEEAPVEDRRTTTDVDSFKEKLASYQAGNRTNTPEEEK